MQIYNNIIKKPNNKVKKWPTNDMEGQLINNKSTALRKVCKKSTIAVVRQPRMCWVHQSFDGQTFAESVFSFEYIIIIE